ncbi:MAG: AAA family ATPase, partial [Anaerolineae bacterium]
MPTTLGFSVAELPSGVVTFLMTDVVGFTPKLRRDEQGTRDAIRDHVRIIASCVTANGGATVKLRAEGDSTFSAFADAGDALAAAVMIQTRLPRHKWPRECEIQVRAALDTGGAEPVDGDYIAPAVNRCSRLLELTQGSQVLLTSDTGAAADGRMPEGAGVMSRGVRRLRSIADPVHLYQLMHPDIPFEFDDPVGIDERKHNFPMWTTSFVGRDDELRTLRDLVRSAARTVSIVGPPGSGKTRISDELALRVLNEGMADVWFVSFATLADKRLVEEEVAYVVGAPEKSDAPLRDSIAAHLADKEALLVFDSCGKLSLELAPVAEHVLKTCPNVRILFTSERRIGFAGEIVYNIPLLSLPALDDSPSRALALADSVRLFVDRARNADPGFELTAANGAAVCRLCRMLDGLPLAIELIAPQVRERSLEAILSLLDQEGTGTASESDRALNQVFEQSFTALSEDERRMFALLAVFRGGFTEEAAAAVVRDVFDEAAAARLLSALVTRSWVRRERLADGAGRCRLLESMRGYARRRLIEYGYERQSTDRHAIYYTDLARRLKPTEA